MGPNLAKAWGSSPRGRGKPKWCCLSPLLVRLIPAWAGKTAAASSSSWREYGSSPRGRGKPAARVSRRRGLRLIPAWAGKTRECEAAEIPAPAHPRVGGENAPFSSVIDSCPGSSPRGRGKPARTASCASQRRLIPAWAGKTPPRCHSITPASAHPRVGGENLHFARREVKGRGSSPRGRGKLSGGHILPLIAGLIPAWAGKTVGVGVDHVGVQAHPRVGGENSSLR